MEPPIRRYSAVAAFSCLLGLATLHPLSSQASAAYPLEALSEDFDRFERVAMRVNPKANADAPALAAALAKGRAELRDGMDLLGFYRLLAPIAASVGCGHSGLRLPAEAEAELRGRGSYLPILVRTIGPRVFAAASLVPGGPEPGSEILAINGRPMDAIVAGLLGDITADGRNLTRKYWILDRQFCELYRLFVDSPERFVVECGQGGRTRSYDLEGMGWEALVSGRAGSGVPEPPPPGADASFSFSPEGVAILRIPGFMYYDPVQRGAFARYLDAFFAELSICGTADLVIDLRDNGGGDPYAGACLLSYLLRSSAPYFAPGAYGYFDLTLPIEPRERAFAGRTFALVNGGCFSTTGHLCSLLKSLKLAILVGEETGGSFSCTDASMDFALPASGIVFRSSTREYQTAVSGLARGRGVLPDLEVSPGVADLLSGRDAVLEAALEFAGRP